MQPVFVVTSGVPGLLYVGGRWAGALTPGEALTFPVSPRGPVYLEHRPLTRGRLPLARRVTLALGRIVPEQAEWADGAATDVAIVQWPGGAIELELTPERAACPSEPPGPDGEAHAREDGSIEVFTDLSDVAGRRQREIYVPTADGYAAQSRALLYASGAPRSPVTPGETARAAVEAMLLGLHGEAGALFAPGREAAARAVAPMIAQYSGVTEMKYAQADGRAAIGLLKREAANMLSVEPLYYAVSSSDGAYRLEWLSRT
jgi:hypothetical protein